MAGAPRDIIELVERFERNRQTYDASGYNETQLRREFIDPLFKALGWDTDNEQGLAEAYKDVIHEDAIKVGGSTKAPDYCFRIGGTRKFFVEAKKPAVAVGSDPAPAYQVRRYAWSNKLLLSIVTNFQEFAVYDGRVKPRLEDKPSTARVLHVKHSEYPERWFEIESVFSKDAILKGSFDKYAESNKRKRGTAEVDDEFLREIESWRDELARNIALRNPDLSERELNYAVGRTIDRILFLRMCEDRGVESYAQLGGLLGGSSTYKRLFHLFRQADDRYNSGLFHFQREKGRAEDPDALTPSLAIDDKILKDIIKSLYYPDCPYEFSVLPPEILGQVYEQFLGKVIRLTTGHRAKVEPKPEVRKAGGVYYTPQYIVEYIVGQTVGQWLVGKSPPEVGPTLDRKASSAGSSPNRALSIVDPACGSGSFLLGAYEYLLDWHLRWYLDNDPGAWARKPIPPVYQSTSRGWQLTIREKKRILLNNIFGVDIDAQAAEVTKLSLLLKVLEGETAETLGSTLRLFHERALPDLSSNIKCGNSLIGPGFFNGHQLDMFDEEEQYRINAFEWEVEFRDIFRSGGFDVVIGNPPYIPTELMRSEERAFYQSQYPSLMRKFDSAAVFILAMIEKLSPRGRLGFISSVTWQTGENYASLREHLFARAGIETLINLPFDVFKGAFVDTGIYIFSAVPSPAYRIYRFPKKHKVDRLTSLPLIRVPTSLVSAPHYRLVLDPLASLILRRTTQDPAFRPLGEVTLSTQGLAGNRFTVVRKGKRGGAFPFLMKGQVRRYRLEEERLGDVDMSDKPSLQRFYESGPKILIRRVISRGDRLFCTYESRRLVFKKDINPFIINDPKLDTYSVLAVLNSRLISYLYLNTSAIATKDDFRQTTLAELRGLPIPKLDAADPSSEHLSGLAARMLRLNERLASTKLPGVRTSLQRQIDATDGQIDQLVYELYGLSDDEIRIIEESTLRT